MFRAFIYPSEVKFYTDNVHVSDINSMSDWRRRRNRRKRGEQGGAGGEEEIR